MLKLKTVGLILGLLVILFSVLGFYPTRALASFPLGITLTPTEPPTSTPTEQITVVPPDATATPTVAPPAATDTPSVVPPTATDPPAPPRNNQRPTPTGALLLPVTGDIPPDSGLDFGAITLLFVALAGVTFIGFKLGARVRRWLS